MDLSKPLYHRRRFPAEIISHCVWLYFRFCLSYRDVEEIMAERGVVVTYETIRDWSQQFGGIYAKRCALERGDLATAGISMRFTCQSMASCGTCGAPSIRTAKYSISLYNLGGTSRLRRSSFESC